jgi:hypothetical protein
LLTETLSEGQVAKGEGLVVATQLARIPSPSPSPLSSRHTPLAADRIEGDIRLVVRPTHAHEREVGHT